MEQQDTEQLADVCAALGITCEAHPWGERTESRFGTHPWKHTLWSCVLRFEGREHGPFEYRMGTGCKDGPTVADTVYSLLADASTFRDARDIDDFAANYCQDLGVMETLRIYRACEDANTAMAKFLGEHRDRCERAEH